MSVVERRDVQSLIRDLHQGSKGEAQAFPCRGDCARCEKESGLGPEVGRQVMRSHTCTTMGATLFLPVSCSASQRFQHQYQPGVPGLVSVLCLQQILVC